MWSVTGLLFLVVNLLMISSYLFLSDLQLLMFSQIVTGAVFTKAECLQPSHLISGFANTYFQIQLGSLGNYITKCLK